VFLLLTPKGDYEGSLRLLAGMARLLASDAVRKKLLAAVDSSSVIAALADAESPPRSIRDPGSGPGSVPRAPGSNPGSVGVPRAPGSNPGQKSGPSGGFGA
jgi:hypothetical protein